jgi:hypothetical protein
MRLESDHDSRQFCSDGKRGTQLGRRPLNSAEHMPFQSANRKVTIQGNERSNDYSRRLPSSEHVYCVVPTSKLYIHTGAPRMYH